jgi:flagellar biosynthetic protein FliP
MLEKITRLFHNKKRRQLIVLLFSVAVYFILAGNVLAADFILPSFRFGIEKGGDPGDVSVLLQIVFLLTVLTLAPAILILTTSFTRLAIVFYFLR